MCSQAERSVAYLTELQAISRAGLWFTIEEGYRDEERHKQSDTVNNL